MRDLWDVTLSAVGIPALTIRVVADRFDNAADLAVSHYNKSRKAEKDMLDRENIAAVLLVSSIAAIQKEE